MARFIIVAEKGSVARAIAKALANSRVDVASVRGHVMEYDLPPGYEWGRVSPVEIMKLRRFKEVITDRDTYRKLAKLFKSYDTLVIATDNDSEGELIGYEVLKIWREAKGPSAPYFRMRFNSTDSEEIRRSWREMEKDLRWEWVEKARFRHLFDLLTGAAFTRLLTQGTRRKRDVRLISWGSCQTACLNFIVEREKEIQEFKPRPFWYIKVVLETERGERFTATSETVWEKEEAERLYAVARESDTAYVESYIERVRRIPRPLPARTDDTLRDLTRITSMPASKLLNVMENLYAEGYISYPRTETNRYPMGFDFNTPLRAVIASGIVAEKLREATVPIPRNGRLDDGAHPPIYPTAAFRGHGIARDVWEYIARRFYANAYTQDAEETKQEATVRISNIPFSASGSYISKEGFYRVFSYFRPSDSKIPRLKRGEELRVVEIKLVEDRTKPPPRLSEADLLRLMERHGIGTDATRATFPQLIVDRGYAVKSRGDFKPTPLGFSLIESLRKADQRLVTPETRRMVEEKMKMIEKGLENFEEALDSSAKTYEGLLNTCRERIEEITSSLAEAIPAQNRLKRRQTSS